MELTEKQRQVFDAAYEQLKDKPWFAGVCMNPFKFNVTDAAIDRDGVDYHVQSVVLETAMWDEPAFFDGLMGDGDE